MNKICSKFKSSLIISFVLSASPLLPLYATESVSNSYQTINEEQNTQSAQYQDSAGSKASIDTSIPLEENLLSEAELAQMLAPIALYPDSLLTHILIASTYPLEVVSAERWVNENSQYEGQAAVEQVAENDWDPSVQALVAFPDVLKRLSTDLTWMRQLGDAFLQNESQVLDSIQSLRQQANDAGTLDEMDNLDVSYEDETIVLQPVEKEVIYVPYYDTRVVYGNWYWGAYPPIYWRPYNTFYAGFYGPFYWNTGVYLSSNYYFCAFNWRNRYIVRDYRHYRGGYYRRHDIIRSGYTRRWKHNPNHRKGVSYRSAHLKSKYKSTRPSYTTSKYVRNKERKLVEGQVYGNRNTKALQNTQRKVAKNRHQKFENNLRKNRKTFDRDTSRKSVEKRTTNNYVYNSKNSLSNKRDNRTLRNENRKQINAQTNKRNVNIKSNNRDRDSKHKITDNTKRRYASTKNYRNVGNKQLQKQDVKRNERSYNASSLNSAYVKAAQPTKPQPIVARREANQTTQKYNTNYKTSETSGRSQNVGRSYTKQFNTSRGNLSHASTTRSTRATKRRH